MQPTIKIALRNLAEPQAVAHAACEKARALAQRFPRLTACKVELERLAPGDAFEAHVELLLPQRQLIVNRDDRDPKGALQAVFEAARRELDLLAQRDRRFAAVEPAALAA